MALDEARAEALEAGALGFPVVGLEVDVDAARMLDRLEEKLRLVVRAVDRRIARIVRVDADGRAERRRPEPDRLGEVIALAVDHQRPEPAAMAHGTSPATGWPTSRRQSATSGGFPMGLALRGVLSKVREEGSGRACPRGTVA